MTTVRYLVERQAGQSDGYRGRAPVPHIHWSEAQKDAYSDAWNVGAALRDACPPPPEQAA